MAVVYRCVGILTVDVSVFHFQDSFPSTFHPRLWETSSEVVAVGVFTAEACQWVQGSRVQTRFTPLYFKMLIILYIIIILYYIILYCIILYCIALHCIALHCIAVLCCVVLYIAVYYYKNVRLLILI